MAALARAVIHHLFVCKDCLAVGTPVDRCIFAVRQPVLVQLQKEPLIPAIVVGITRCEQCIPVEHAAQRLQLFRHGVNVLQRAVFRMDAGLDRIVFCRQTERIEADWLKDLVTAHLLHARPGIGRCIIEPVPDMELCARGIREHLQHIQLLIKTFRIECGQFHVGPFLLPFAINFYRIHGLPRFLAIPTILARILIKSTFQKMGEQGQKEKMERIKNIESITLGNACLLVFQARCK